MMFSTTSCTTGSTSARSRAGRLGTALLVVLGATGCSDGDGGGGATTGGEVGDSGTLNGPLTGRVLSGTVLYDLRTGERASLPFSGAAVPNSDASVFTAVDTGCGTTFDPVHCAIAVDTSGVELWRFDLGGEFAAVPRLAPDESLVAVVLRPDILESRLVVSDVSGRVVNGAPGVREDVYSPRWLADGRLIYEEDDALWLIGQPVSGAEDADRLVWSAPPGMSGTMTGYDVSPDGSRIAFAWQTDPLTGVSGDISSLFVVGIDGTGLREIGTGELWPSVSDPLWSPDGAWIVANAGGLSVNGDNSGFAYRPDANVAFNADASGPLRADTEASSNTEDLIFLRASCTEDGCPQGGDAELMDDVSLSAWLP